MSSATATLTEPEAGPVGCVAIGDGAALELAQVSNPLQSAPLG